MSNTETKRKVNPINLLLILIIILGLTFILMTLFKVSDRANERAAQIEALTAQTTALEAEKTALSDELTAVKAELTATKAELDAAYLTVAETDAALAEANARLDQAEASLNQMLKGIQTIRNELNAMPAAEEAESTEEAAE